MEGKINSPITGIVFIVRLGCYKLDLGQLEVWCGSRSLATISCSGLLLAFYTYPLLNVPWPRVTAIAVGVAKSAHQH